MKITIIGTGYVGLVSGACFAEVGNHVLCLDTNPDKIKILQEGGIPIHEPGLEVVIQRNIAAGRLSFTTDIARAVTFGEVQFIAVGTPPDEDGSADLTYVIAAASAIGQYMTEPVVIVDKSTVPVGTADKVRLAIQKAQENRQTTIPFSVVSNPEFLKEGAALDDFMRPDRIVIGVDDDRGYQTMKALYAPFQRNRERLISMDIRSAELTKYAANAMLATRISFMNELALLADKLGADIEKVRHGIGSDPRIGYHFLYPGCGYGGSCFPKDVRALQKTAQEVGAGLKIIQAVEQVNHTQKHFLLDRLIQRFGENLAQRQFALWGLAFKPNTDDMREAPSRVLIDGLLTRGATVVAYDPVAMEEASRIYSGEANFKVVASPEMTLSQSSALIIVTEWREFRSPDFKEIKTLLKIPLIIDGRNLYEPEFVRSYGLQYECIGRP